MVKKRNLNEVTTQEEQIVIETEITQEKTVQEEENTEYGKLLLIAQNIRKGKTILGYIIKNEAKATVDLNDSSKIIEYAMLTSQAFESAETLSSIFTLGDIQTILIEGKNAKALCIGTGQNQLGIFMEKATNHSEILKEFMP